MGSTITRKVKNGKYLYYMYYDKGRRIETYCGRAESRESRKKLLKCELEELVKRKEEIARRIEAATRKLAKAGNSVISSEPPGSKQPPSSLAFDGFAGAGCKITWPGKDAALLQIRKPPAKKLKLKAQMSQNNRQPEHMLLEGDNLEILKILMADYEGKIRVIYIDPPYNTMKSRAYKDSMAHFDWMTMMYPRLHIARQLLSQEGTIFISIGLDESHRLRIMLDDIFGEQNFLSEIAWHSKYTTANDKKFISTQHEYIMAYSKNKSKAKLNLLPRTKAADAAYKNPDGDPRGRWKPTPLHAKSGRKNIKYKFTKIQKYSGEIVKPFVWSAPDGRYPRYSRETLRAMEADKRITCGRDGKGVPNAKTFLSEVRQGMVAGSLWKYDDVGHTHEANEELAGIVGKGAFDNPKPTKLIKRILALATRCGTEDIVLDFFAGSGTTAQSVLEMNSADNGNRRFICVQDEIPIRHPQYRTITDVARRRIEKVIKKLKMENATGFKNCELS